MAYRTAIFGNAHAGLLTVGYVVQAANGTLGSRITAGVAEVGSNTGVYGANVDESTSPVRILWDTGEATPVHAAESLQILNPQGVYDVTLHFRDASSSAVPNVPFVVLGQGSGTADGSGNASINLNAGTYTVRAAPTSTVLFSDASITVSTDGQTFTINGSGASIPGPSAPGLTIAFAYAHGDDDQVAAGLVATVRLVDPNQSQDLWYRRNRECTSDADGLVSWEVLQDADYQIKFGLRGAWVDFHTGTDTTHHITPQVLGEYGS
jgi:hypothetical protein